MGESNGGSTEVQTVGSDLRVPGRWLWIIAGALVAAFVMLVPLIGAAAVGHYRIEATDEKASANGKRIEDHEVRLGRLTEAHGSIKEDVGELKAEIRNSREQQAKDTAALLEAIRASRK